MVRLSKHNYMPMFATASSLVNNIFPIIVGVMLSTAKADYLSQVKGAIAIDR